MRIKGKCKEFVREVILLTDRLIDESSKPKVSSVVVVPRGK